MKKLIFGDGTVPCQACRAALCSTSDHYCSACGAPLRAEIAPYLTGDSAFVAIALARLEARENGTLLQ